MLQALFNAMTCKGSTWSPTEPFPVAQAVPCQPAAPAPAWAGTLR